MQNLDFEHLLNSFMYFHGPFGPCLHVDVIMNDFLFYVSLASDFGLTKIDDTGRTIPFSEKPKGDELKAMVCWIFLFIPANFL